MNISRSRILVLSIIAVLIAGLSISFFASDIYRYRLASKKAITKNLTDLTPIGMTIDEVEEILKEKGWSPRVSRNVGFSKQESGTAKHTVGKQSIRTHLGNYRLGIFDKSVSAFWGFNSEGELIEVWVWKIIDGL